MAGNSVLEEVARIANVELATLSPSITCTWPARDGSGSEEFLGRGPYAKERESQHRLVVTALVGRLREMRHVSLTGTACKSLR